VTESAAATPPEPAGGQWSKGTETVLLVEDAPMIRRLARQIMVRAGYTVIEAGDANQAMELVEKHPCIDVLLTDLIMPGPSGVELAEPAQDDASRHPRAVHVGLHRQRDRAQRDARRERRVPAEAVHARRAAAQNFRNVIDAPMI